MRILLAGATGAIGRPDPLFERKRSHGVWPGAFGTVSARAR